MRNIFRTIFGFVWASDEMRKIGYWQNLWRCAIYGGVLVKHDDMIINFIVDDQSGYYQDEIYWKVWFETILPFGCTISNSVLF